MVTIPLFVLPSSLAVARSLQALSRVLLKLCKNSSHFLELCFPNLCEVVARFVAMTGAGKFLGMDKLRVQNLLVAGGLTSFVGAVYFYTMKAVGSGDDLQEAVQILNQEKEATSAAPSAAS